VTVKPIRDRLFAILIVCFTFFLFLLLAHPAYNSDDDTYFLYALSGAYGIPPTNLLHYSFSWHPVLSWPILQAFQFNPRLNWYSITLLGLHLFSCIHLVNLLLTQFTRKQSVLVFLVFFLFVEARLLLSLNYSGTSLALCLSGFCSFLVYHKEIKHRAFFKKELLVPVLLVLLGGLMRPHMFALYLLLTLSTGIFLIPRSYYRGLLQSLIFPGLTLLLFVVGQQLFYKQVIRDWKERNDFREAFFSLHNQPMSARFTTDSTTLVKNSFIKYSFIYDSSFISQDDLKDFAKNSSSKRIGLQPDTQNKLYWAFQEMRVYLLLWASILAFFLLAGGRRPVYKWLIQCLPAVFLFCYLYLFLKLTEPVFLALFSAILFAAVFTAKGESLKNKISRRVLFFLLFISSTWMVKRLISMDARNTHRIAQSRAAIRQLNSNNKFLFISTDNYFPLSLSAWDTPSDYPLKNFINKELALTGMHEKVLRRWRISSLASVLPYRSDVLLIGEELPLLPQFYNHEKNWDVFISKQAQWGYLNIYQLRIKND
jgi:hypothetical protein